MSDFEYCILDNFLDHDQHKFIEDTMIGSDAMFPWYLNSCKSHDGSLMCYDDLNNFQFTHVFHRGHTITTEWYSKIAHHLILKINPLAIIRIKANLTPVTTEILKYGWHVDFDNHKHKTAVYYVNTNNGKTIFKNGLEVDSVANRLVIFDGSMPHTATSCTDKKVRCVINLNYVKE